MIAALVVGFLFSIAWISVAVWMMLKHSPEFLTWGILITLSTLVYCTYMGIVAVKLLGDSRRKYLLELTQTEAVLSTVDRADAVGSTKMVLLDDVKYAEYYPYPDSASAILHAPYADMEIPLWPFGAQAQDAIDFLAGRGITIVNVLSDDRIPE
jgi:hypothetical protein